MKYIKTNMFLNSFSFFFLQSNKNLIRTHEPIKQRYDHPTNPAQKQQPISYANNLYLFKIHESTR